jgi:succinate dehydrogenase/fumarate reductase flavoprotein subunit
MGGGSSLIDILVYVETVIKGRRVFLDYRANGTGFSFDELSPEARTYLENSGAHFGTPIERLATMNQPAIDLYADHGIDITREPLEIAVCAQHNNGGLAGNLWWESENIRHLFPLGEVNGSHGVYRPGGSALNSGQVAGFRAAEYIAHAYAKPTLNGQVARDAAAAALGELHTWLEVGHGTDRTWQAERDELQARMSRAAAHIRSPEVLTQAVAEAWTQWRELRSHGCRQDTAADAVEALRNRQLTFAHAVYLEAVQSAVTAGVGSRGSALVLAQDGLPAHPLLGDEWRFAPENTAFKQQVLETVAAPDGRVENRWCPCRPIPASDAWFETAWAAFRQGNIYR